MSLASKNEFENQTFKKEICLEQDLRNKSFYYSIFESCDFTKGDLRGSRFLDCTLTDCNWSLVKLDGCRLQNVQFESCKFTGVNWGKCDPQFLSIQFQNCLIDTSNFSDLNLQGALFRNCVLRDTFFTNCKLVDADFKGSDLKGSSFHNADLSRANFQGAMNYALNPLTNKLTKAKFSKPEVLAILQYLDIIIE